MWGSTGLSPWFPNPESKTGEVWFDGGNQLPLIKFLFTTERLSVQVHPNDEFAAEHEKSNGKTEMWHILQAAPAAQVAIGFRQHTTPAAVREAALDGTLDGMLNWIRVRPGDTLFVPAGTVHAIGAGLALCEIQQQSDVTYRLFDYGRPRELHLDRALQVANFGTCTARAMMPVRCPHFNTERYVFQSELQLEPIAKVNALVFLEGEGLVDGEPFIQGQAWEVAADSPVSLQGHGVVLRTWIP